MSVKKFIAAALSGSLIFGFSSIVSAESFATWIFATQKLDCVATCKNYSKVPYPIATGIDNNLRKPSFFICATRKNREWRPGSNEWEKNKCTTVFNDAVYHGENYYCRCTNKPEQPFK